MNLFNELVEEFKEDEEYMEAVGKLEDLVMDPEFAGAYDKGKVEKKIEIVKNLLNLGTVSLEDISKTIGLDLDILNDLSK